MRIGVKKSRSRRRVFDFVVQAGKRSGRVHEMRRALALLFVSFVGCAVQRPPQAVRDCMRRVPISRGTEPERELVITQSTAACGMRETCLDTLRRRSCDVGGAMIVIKSETAGGSEGPAPNTLSPIATRGGRVAQTYIQITAWITRADPARASDP